MHFYMGNGDPWSVPMWSLPESIACFALKNFLWFATKLGAQQALHCKPTCVCPGTNGHELLVSSHFTGIFKYLKVGGLDGSARTKSSTEFFAGAVCIQPFQINTENCECTIWHPVNLSSHVFKWQFLASGCGGIYQDRKQPSRISHGFSALLSSILSPPPPPIILGSRIIQLQRDIRICIFYKI